VGTGGKKYPPKRAIARKLLSEGQYIILKTREANYWWYGDSVQSMPLQLYADYNAILDQMAQKEKQRQKKYFPRPQYPTIMPERVAATSAPMTQETQPKRSATRETIPAISKSKPSPFGRKPGYRQPLASSEAEKFAQHVYQKLCDLSEGKQGRSSISSARRMVAEYGESSVRQALKITATRRNVRKPIGFIATLLRSEKVEKRLQGFG
jgi:hypothetical protein